MSITNKDHADLLACAKIMHDDVKPGLLLSTPRFQQQADGFVRDMLQYDTETIAEML